MSQTVVIPSGDSWPIANAINELVDQTIGLRKVDALGNVLWSVTASDVAGASEHGTSYAPSASNSTSIIGSVVRTSASKHY